MKYRIKNMTFSPLRIIMNGIDIRLTPRKNTFLEKINEDLLLLERQKLIRIKKMS